MEGTSDVTLHDRPVGALPNGCFAHRQTCTSNMGAHFKINPQHTTAVVLHKALQINKYNDCSAFLSPFLV